MNVSVFPELVTGRRDGFRQKSWKIEVGSPIRGGASCNLSEHILRVPTGTTETERVVRAHELAHVRMSPYLPAHIPSGGDVSPWALECAEEFRVNLILNLLGYDVGLLRDGTERVGGQRIAHAGSWDEAVCFYLAVAGTGAESDYLRGIRSVQPTWASALKSLKKQIARVVGDLEISTIVDTRLGDDGVPAGYQRVTVALATLISRTMSAAAPSDADSLRLLRRSFEPGARRAPSGVAAPLVFDEAMPFVTRRVQRASRRWRPSTTGTVMKYPDRLLTDPSRRAFGRKSPAAGGVVVIDQSGSMDVTTGEIERMLVSAPHALIIGYSHRPGDLGSTPNVWILARDGRVVAGARTGNIGNGVDVTVLRWAIHQAQRREVVVWVTDGQVTDSHDHPCHMLSLECALMVRQHRIRMVRTLEEVRPALRGRPGNYTGFGRVGRELSQLASR